MAISHNELEIRKPNYQGAFQMNLGSLPPLYSAPTGAVYDFRQNQRTSMNELGLRVGNLLANTDNFKSQLAGNNILNQVGQSYSAGLEESRYLGAPKQTNNYKPASTQISKQDQLEQVVSSKGTTSTDAMAVANDPEYMKEIMQAKGADPGMPAPIEDTEANRQHFEQVKADSEANIQAQKDAKSAAFNKGLGQAGQALSTLGGSIGGKAGAAVSGTGNVLSAISNAKGNGFGGAMGIVGAGADLIGGFMPEKTEYSGDKGSITQGMDSAYDAISNAAAAFGPWGMAVSGIMKGGKLLGQGLNALGGGTDGMCVCAGTKVFTAAGKVVNVEDLQQEDGIIGWNQTAKPQHIDNIVEPRYKECLHIEFESGNTLECSVDHPILLYGGFFQEARYLGIRDVITISNYPKEGIRPDTVVNIIPMGVQKVYNLSVSPDHTYLANGIITHNTTTDAILGSSFFNLTPLGMVNGFGGKKADTITKNNELFNTMGSSYSGTENKVDSAVTKSGKKYGLLSSSARKKANQEIAEAKRQQRTVEDISDLAQDRFALANAMTDTNTARYAFQLNGGYNQSDVRVGRSGMKLANLQRTISIVKAKRGAKVHRYTQKPKYQEWVLSVPTDRLNSNYDLETAYKYLPLDVLENWRLSSIEDLENGKNHLNSIAPIEGTEDYIFLKKGVNDEKAENYNPELHFETDTYYNGSNGLKDTHDLVYEGDRYYYRKKKLSDPVSELTDVEEDSVPLKNGGVIQLLNPADLANEPDEEDLDKFKEGGVIISPESIADLPDFSEVELLDPATLADLPDVDEFKEGGSINVIPDGALHARLHHMEDADDLTKKGIPVVDNNGEQQAEVEVGELIIRLDVTKKLEELEKKYNSEETSQKEKDEAALEAGKLLTEEILHNTDDKTKSLL